MESNPSASGAICWLLENARLFDCPVPMHGQLGVFSVNGPDAQKVQRAIRTAKATKAPRVFTDFWRRWEKTDRDERDERLVESYLELASADNAFRVSDAAIKRGSKKAIFFAARGWAKPRLISFDDDVDDAFQVALEGARKDLDKAIKLDPNEATFRFWRAAVYHFQALPDKKKSDIAIGKKLDPSLNWQQLEQARR